MIAPTRPRLSDVDMWDRACKRGIPVTSDDPRLEQWFLDGRLTRVGDRWWGDRRANPRLTAEQRAAAADEAAWKRQDDR